MASLYKKPKSPFWYLRFRAADGKWKHQSTGFRWVIAAETRKARQLEAETTAKEHGLPRRSPTWQWVHGWMETHFTKEITRTRANQAWVVLEAFLAEVRLERPVQVQREHCHQYIVWRTKAQNPKWSDGSKRRLRHHNTALLELRYFSQVLGEAKLRGYIQTNPAERLGIGKAKSKEKAPLTDAEIELLRSECRRRDKDFLKKGKPVWMVVCLEIALHQGVRLSETKVPMSNVDLERGTITFQKTKGDKPFTAIIHPHLRPVLEKLKASGAEFTCDTPHPAASKAFYDVFQALGIQNTFHATRVTVVTRLALAGIDERLSKLYVNHSSSIVHAIYTKLKAEDATGVTDALNYGSRGPGKSA